MNNKIIVVEQKVPTCPVCSALMWKRYQDGKLFFVCGDNIEHIYGVVDNGQTENELLVSDSVKIKKNYLKRNFRNFLCESLGEMIKKGNELPKYHICFGNRGNNFGGMK